MRVTRVLILTLLVLLAGQYHVAAQCPADVAAEKGESAFHVFHEVMAPAWHEAYPAEDYEALIAAAPGFTDAFAKVAAMKPELSSEAKQKRFDLCRDKLGALVADYAAKAKAGDNEGVYNLMPKVHTAFEQAASALLPVSYPQLEGIIVTIDLIINKHLPANNTEGIIGSTETLVTKAAALNGETLPGLLAFDREDIMPTLEHIRKLATEMKSCCDKNDMENFAKHATALSETSHTLADTYL